MELLAPAGNLEKLKIAIEYGADAVYCGMEGFSLRAKSGNFTIGLLRDGVDYAHKHGKKLYLAINIFAHNYDIDNVESVLEQIKDIDIDGFIVSDLGILSLIRQKIPSARVHISTQANVTNHATASFYKDYGAKRVILARELTFGEIREIRAKSGMEVEIFVHGAMCISYSGRCLISDFLTNRSANKGDCTHPCRWEYRVEEKERQGEYFPVDEDGRYTYFFNSKDLNLVEKIPAIIDAGIDSIKIEGRNKGLYYLAMVVRAYRKAIDNYLENRDNSAINSHLRNELDKISNRSYSTGFFDGYKGEENQNYENSNYIRKYDFIGIIKGMDGEYAVAEIRGKVLKWDRVEVCSRNIDDDFESEVLEIVGEQGEELDFTKPNTIVKLKLSRDAAGNSFVRKKR